MVEPSRLLIQEGALSMLTIQGLVLWAASKAHGSCTVKLNTNGNCLALGGERNLSCNEGELRHNYKPSISEPGTRRARAGHLHRCLFCPHLTKQFGLPSCRV